MTTTVDALVTQYLARLGAAAGELPPERREELLQGIREHISEARAAGGVEDEAGVRTLLDRLGEPEEIVDAAREDAPYGPAAQVGPPGTGLELAAVLMLTAGSLLPVLGWLVGVVLLWASPRWRWTEKLVGTLVVPLGPGGALLLGGLAPSTTSCSTEVSSDGSVVEQCSGFVLPLPVGLLLLAAVLVAPVVVAVVLLRRARQRAAAEPPVVRARRTAR